MSRAAVLAASYGTLTTNPVPAGTVAYFGMSSAPTGWLSCNGSAVSRTTYEVLFALIGTTYGSGDGSTTFNVPDLRGEFIRGLDGGRGVDTGRALGSAQTGNVADHKHELPISFSANSGDIQVKSLTPEFGQSSSTWTSSHTNGGGSATGRTGQYNVYSSVPVAASVSGETRPRNVALLPCIKT